MQAYVVAISMVVSLFSCSQSPKVTDPDEFGRVIFDLFKKGERDKIISYIITEDEIQKVFSTNEYYKALSEKEQRELVRGAFEDTKKHASGFIEIYTDKTNKEAIALQNGSFVSVSSQSKIDKGPPVTRIMVLFSSEGVKYALNLDAAKVDDYWKLLTWIEVKKLY